MYSGTKNFHIVYVLFSRCLNDFFLKSKGPGNRHFQNENINSNFVSFFSPNNVPSGLSNLINCRTVFVSRTALVIISHWFLLVLLFGKQVIDIKSHFCDLFFCLFGLPWKPEACIQAFVNRKDILHAVFLFQVCVYIIIFIFKPLNQKKKTQQKKPLPFTICICFERYFYRNT